MQASIVVRMDKETRRLFKLYCNLHRISMNECLLKYIQSNVEKTQRWRKEWEFITNSTSSADSSHT